ncbi:MAG: DUF1461 domain-containing protein [Clostridiales bacterium]|nr:DUF1461 domain-containing protein [Clostridiales bacterium]
MKFFDKLILVVLNILLLLLSAIVPSIIIASTPAFYETQFIKTELCAPESGVDDLGPVIRYIDGDSTKSARFTNEQMQLIAKHIIDYMFTDKESFALVMDDVYLNGSVQDNVSIFGEIAVKHMEDVKILFGFLIKFSIVALAVVLSAGIYLFCRKEHTAPILLKQTLGFYGTFIGIAALFCAVVAIQAHINDVEYFSQLWHSLHSIFFLFEPNKIEGSFFNDALTCILTLEFFLGAVKIVVATMGGVLAAWLTLSTFAKIRSKRKSTNF